MTNGSQSDSSTPAPGIPGSGSPGRDNAHAVIDEVLGGFRGVCRGAMIFRSITSAMQPGRLILALLMVMVLVAGGRFWDGMSEGVFPNWAHYEGEAFVGKPLVERMNLAVLLLHRNGITVDADQLKNSPAMYSGGNNFGNRRAGRQAIGKNDQLPKQGAFAFTASVLTHGMLLSIHGVTVFSFDEIVSGGGSVFITLPRMLWQNAPLFTIFYGLFFLAVLALGGGTLARMSAMQTASGGRLTVRDSTNFALSHWVTLMLTPILPLIIIAVLGLILAVAGWLLFMFPILEVIGGLAYAVALLGGFLIAFLVIGYLAGFPMLIPSYCCETSGAGDAMQRAYAYALQKPLYLAWYFFLALIGLIFGYILVAIFASVTLNFTGGLVGLWSDNVVLNEVGETSMFNLYPSPLTKREFTDTLFEISENYTIGLIDFWRVLVGYLVASWVFSYLCSASTTIYLLMRKAVDGQSIEEIWEPRTAV